MFKYYTVDFVNAHQIIGSLAKTGISFQNNIYIFKLLIIMLISSSWAILKVQYQKKKWKKEMKNKESLMYWTDPWRILNPLKHIKLANYYTAIMFYFLWKFPEIKMFWIIVNKTQTITKNNHLYYDYAILYFLWKLPEIKMFWIIVNKTQTITKNNHLYYDYAILYFLWKFPEIKMFWIVVNET